MALTKQLVANLCILSLTSAIKTKKFIHGGHHSPQDSQARGVMRTLVTKNIIAIASVILLSPDSNEVSLAHASDVL